MKRFLWVNIVLGLWLLAAPYVLGYASSVAALTNDMVLGILVIGGAWWVMAGLAGGFAAAPFEALCGFWLPIARFVLNISHLPGTLFNEMVSASLCSWWACSSLDTREAAGSSVVGWRVRP